GPPLGGASDRLPVRCRVRAICAGAAEPVTRLAPFAPRPWGREALPGPPMEPPQEFRWQALFQRSRQPLFLLDHHRRLLLANGAWMTLTGLTLAEVRGRACTRRRLPATPTRWDEVARALAPPVTILHGPPARLRRLVAGIPWDIDFFPLQQDDSPL